MRIAFAGSPAAALPTLEWLSGSKHELVRIFTQPDRPAGRGKALTSTPVGLWADNNSIPAIKATHANELANHLHDIECVVTVGYGILLPQHILDIPRHGFINLHFSLLPAWRGAAPVQRAIENQDPFTGVTVFQLDAGMDTGPYFEMSRFALDDDITSDELLSELAELGVEAIKSTLTKIEKGVMPTPQSREGVSRALKLNKAEGKIDWNRDAKSVSAHIRAFTSNPGAWTSFRGQLLKIEVASISNQQLLPGQIKVFEKRLLIGTADYALEISHLTPQGKARIESASWVNGARLSGDDFCE